MFDFKRITLLCLGYRRSKHEMTIYAEHLGEAMASWPPLATPMAVLECFSSRKTK